MGRRETDIERGVQVEVDGDTKMGPRRGEKMNLCAWECLVFACRPGAAPFCLWTLDSVPWIKPWIRGEG